MDKIVPKLVQNLRAGHSVKRGLWDCKMEVHMIVVETLLSLLLVVFIAISIAIFITIRKWGNYFSRWNREFMRG